MTGNGSPLRIGVCLSLSGKFARFGNQALHGLRVWRELDGDADLVVEDDESDPVVLEARLPRVAMQSDIVLGPYSTHLMRTAGRIAAERGWLLWNHGGSGDDVEGAHPGHIVSILTPTSRYAEPFLRLLASEREHARLWVVHGKGRFGRQVATGAERIAVNLGLDVVRVKDGVDFTAPDYQWDVFTVGQFEGDAALVKRYRSFPNPPRNICSVAAGVREFHHAIEDTDGIFGIAQWFPGGNLSRSILGPPEKAFVSAYRRHLQVMPDYPAVQAAVGAVVAAHCARQSNGLDRDTLWSAATSLETDTLYGAFGIDPNNGTQVKHQTTLVRWDAATPHAVTVP
ncbi:ABC transporter substrate-binding protein [Kibdelosporangium aridum]|uniref:ABC transporter substrate-binding protein n=1 Tax=Kibdelosporangium aridum TaxID=2030 RepID=UPI0035E9D70D